MVAPNQRAFGAFAGEAVRYRGADAARGAGYDAAAAGEGADCHAGRDGLRSAMYMRGGNWVLELHVSEEGCLGYVIGWGV